MRLLALLCLVVPHVACNGTRRLDEHTFLARDGLELKVVRYDQRLFLHYNGEVFTVQCRSAATAGSPATATQDAGWVSMGNGGAIGAGDARAIAERERVNYVVLDRGVLVWTGTTLTVGFGECDPFTRWDPTTLPSELLVSFPKPDFCAPVGTGDCRYIDFQGERQPQFSDIRTEAPGHLAFRVRAAAIRDGATVAVETTDRGLTWTTAVE